MKIILRSIFAMVLAVSLYSCGGSEEPQDQEETPDGKVNDSTEVVEEEKKYKLTPLTDSPEYADASLKVSNPGSDDNAKIFVDEVGDELSFKSDDLEISFNVENFELGSQTEDAETKGIAFSGKGQHIHFILNNGPYSAKYEPKADFKGEAALEDGNYVMLAFLARSYHESVKNKNAFALYSFKIGEPEEEGKFDAYGEHLFYSRPKGTYKGDDTKKVLFDFYLVNTEIKEGGNYVELTINGEQTEKITTWQPYLVEGLNMGENTFKIELKDKDGNPVEGPFNSEERTITLAEAAE